MKQEKGDGGGGGGGGGKKLGRWLGAPVRALSRACDSYVRKMSACAGHMPVQYAGAVGRGGFGGPGSMNAAAFSSRSTRRGDDAEVAELVRAMSQRSAARASPDAAAVPVRSRSVAVGRIDEDAPVEFGADAGRVGLPPPAVRRSRSAAVGGASAGFPPRSGGFGAAATKKAQGGVGGGAAAVVVHGG